MKTFLMLCLVALITGCNSQKKPAPDHSAKDTVIVNIPESEQLKAIGDINFFISEKTFNIKKDAFLKSSHNPDSEDLYSTSLSYRLGKYEFLRMDSHFNNDSLFYVSLIGYIYRENFIPNFKNQYDALYALLSTKYGNPCLLYTSSAGISTNFPSIKKIWLHASMEKIRFLSRLFFTGLNVKFGSILTQIIYRTANYTMKAISVLDVFFARCLTTNRS